MIKYLFFVLLMGLIGCVDKDIKQIDPYQIRELGELSTTEYTFGKVLKIDDKGEWYTIGDRKILITCQAKVKAGIDLKSIQSEDIEIKGRKISIVLPEVVVTSFSLDAESIKVEVQNVNGFRSTFTQDEKNKILQLGENKIREEMLTTDLFRDARANAIVFLTTYYKSLGYDEVEILVGNEEGY